MNTAYHQIIDQFSQAKVLVIGDVILDVYLKGGSTRLSPEAPVPVVNISDRSYVVGGAANIAVNFKALEAQVAFLSAVGNDEDAAKIFSILEKQGIDSTHIFQENTRQTTVKTRVMCQSQILARYDYGTDQVLNQETEQKIVDYLEAHYADFDIIMAGDYYGGILTPAIINTLAKLQQNWPRIFAVDSKNLTAFRKVKPTLVKPNYTEAVKLLELNHQAIGRAEQMHRYGDELYEKTGASIVALTLDADGAMIFNEGIYKYRSYAHHLPGASVVGAGDTFISTLSLGLFLEADIPLATELATAAAAIAVSKEGTVPCTYPELRSFFSLHNKYVSHVNELKKLCEIYEAQGKKIVFTNGCFDILHSGHVSYLNRAKELGDVLIVGMNCDDSIRRLKGEGRPINPLEDRIEVLAGLSSIDHVISFEEDSPVYLIRAARPHIYAKGGDYSKETLPEAKLVEDLGGKIVFVPLVPDHSTTRIIRRINNGSTLKIA
ncbi:D-glycero-beta-D-manno-heptose 1-phosphate adenylyltransferase [Mucilaginibacter sp. RS28]|uniref:Bifunctional protein HldE n=1 Tax=Mucilaginibacter straminoryzae TaxID=2932774 RepID=A0A9X2B9C3_9SPHI|nr:D-glycero-beta-D-manno-heptose 1-phosphate adenylyltransferase [Mucilaginibacter straminoryzae]MCJ8210331.1 D-glycero-beta-D-manno-heptose 1-phosphate adenylyltransferase [Mucilaginibacter straminoryzae]